MPDDLKSLGKRGWLKNLTDPKPSRPQDSDSNIVTRYGAGPGVDLGEMRRLVANDDENCDLKDMLAFALYSQGELDEAMKLYKELLSARHKPAQQRFYLGNCYYRKRLHHLAVQEWSFVAQMSDAPPDLRRRAQTRVEKVRQGSAIQFTETR